MLLRWWNYVPAVCSAWVALTVRVYPCVSREFVGATEAFLASRVGAGEWFLTGVCADMSCLYLHLYRTTGEGGGMRKGGGGGGGYPNKPNMEICAERSSVQAKCTNDSINHVI